MARLQHRPNLDGIFLCWQVISRWESKVAAEEDLRRAKN
jgi:hypothetical protein